MLQGAFSALVTPFVNGKLDEEKYREFIEWQIAEGSSALVPCGTTGEAATLTKEEQFAIVTSLGRPVYALPPLREGVDASGVRVLAQELNDQAEW